MLNVLVVDDDAIVRESVVEALKDAGHFVDQATNGDNALALILEHVFDVVVCDVQMPGLGGLALFRQLRWRSPSTSVIFMTAFARVEDAVRTLRDGAADYVCKPFDPTEFVRDVIGPIAERRGLRMRSEHARAVRERVAFLARMESSVLITGTRGTDPEVVARTIHAQSARRLGPFVVIPCESLAERTFEAEYEALSRSRPLFERDAWFRAAEGGTLFLRDIDAMPMSVQAALLRIMDEPELQARRDQDWHASGVRVVSSSHQDLSQRANAGLFLESLSFKLSGRVLELQAAES